MPGRGHIAKNNIYRSFKYFIVLLIRRLSLGSALRICIRLQWAYTGIVQEAGLARPASVRIAEKISDICLNFGCEEVALNRRHSFRWLGWNNIDTEDSTMRLGAACSNLLWQLITAKGAFKSEGKRGITDTPATTTPEHNPKATELEQ